MWAGRFKPTAAVLLECSMGRKAAFVQALYIRSLCQPAVDQAAAFALRSLLALFGHDPPPPSSSSIGMDQWRQLSASPFHSLHEETVLRGDRIEADYHDERILCPMEMEDVNLQAERNQVLPYRRLASPIIRFKTIHVYYILLP